MRVYIIEVISYNPYGTKSRMDGDLCRRIMNIESVMCW